MDYDEQKTSYRPHVLWAAAVIGCFVLIGFYEPITQNLSQQKAEIINVLTDSMAGTTLDVDAYAWIAQALRDQTTLINTLRQENMDLYAQIASSTATSTATTTVVVAVEPKHVLLVAGHTQSSKGAVFGSVTEYDQNYSLMQATYEALSDMGYRVTLSHRDDDYSYRFSSYFEQYKDLILDWRETQRAGYEDEYPLGVVTNDTDHNTASTLATLQLYGINYWANQNDIDAVIHLHFNDYPGRVSGQVGKHTGFSLFTSLKTNDNFIESFRLAKEIEKNMLHHAERSTVTRESAGVLESELIAVGQANSLEAPAVLIESGFIYEDKFINPAKRNTVMGQYADSIARGLDAYLSPDPQ